MKRCFILFPLMLALLAAGCMAKTYRQPIDHSLLPGLAQQKVDAPTSKSFLIKEFKDARGGALNATHPTSWVPVVNLFHIGGEDYYPEQSTMMGFRDRTLAGAMDRDLPGLLAFALKEMGGAETAVVEKDADPDTAFDYVVTGRIKSTRFDTDMSVLVMILGIVGLPHYFTAFEIEYEITLHRAGDEEPMMTETYQWSGKRVSGWYYGFTPYYDMFVEALEATVGQAVRDIVAAAKQ